MLTYNTHAMAFGPVPLYQQNQNLALSFGQFPHEIPPRQVFRSKQHAAIDDNEL
jgi:hypothetical protein